MTSIALLRRGCLIAAFLLPLGGCAVTGFFTYGIPNVGLNSISEGDSVPDVKLVSLAGADTQLRDYLNERPLVLIFGSFT